MSLAIATIPGKLGEGSSQLLDSALVELNSTAPGVVTYNLQALIGPQARIDGVSIYNGTSRLVRVTARDGAGNPIGQLLGADGEQLVNPAHTIQFGFEEADLIAFLDFEPVAFPVSVGTGQVVAADTLIPVLGAAGEFLSVNVIEK
jgi:hypothetical protein